MPRDRVFISYSHQDEAFLQAFRVHLKPWEDRELLETWSDHQINTSQDWHLGAFRLPCKRRQWLFY